MQYIGYFSFNTYYTLIRNLLNGLFEPVLGRGGGQVVSRVGTGLRCPRVQCLLPPNLFKKIFCNITCAVSTHSEKEWRIKEKNCSNDPDEPNLT